MELIVMKIKQTAINKLFVLILAPVLMLAPALLLIPVPAQEEEQEQTIEDKTLSPYFFVQGDPEVDHLPLKGTNVDVAVSGVIADVKVGQTYKNEGARPINATYVFPASTRAAVYSMRMKIGDEIIYAKIKEREAAKKDFEKAKKEGKSASLLEEHRPNVFSMSLANIMPNDQIEIELRYTELLIPTDGEYEFVYPTVVGPRYPSAGAKDDSFVKTPYLHEGVNGSSTLHISTSISAGMPIRELTCLSHQIAPEWRSASVAELTLDEADAFQANRDYVLHYRLSGDQMTSGLLLFKGEKENFFLYMAQPPERVTEAEIPPREYIFVVDVSGSMSGFPINTAKNLLGDLIGHLRPTDYFDVVLFSGDSTTLSTEPLAANQENVSRAFDLLDRQRGAGGTELLPALQEAMKIPHRQKAARSIVVVTDGYISGESDLFEYIKENRGGANIFSFGIGSSVNRYLIDGVAKAGLGEPFVVADQSQASATADKFREYIQSPLLTNVEIRSHGFETYDVQPGRFSDLLAKRPVILFGKWKGNPTGTLELTGTNGQGEYSNSIDVSAVQPDENNRALRYLWARSNIAELSDFGSDNVSDEKVKAITELGLEYNLLTKYTSFIAVREKIVNPFGSAKDVTQPLPMPAGVSDMAVGSEPQMIYLIIAGCLMGLLMFAGRRIRILGS